MVISSQLTNLSPELSPAVNLNQNKDLFHIHPILQRALHCKKYKDDCAYVCRYKDNFETSTSF